MFVSCNKGNLDWKDYTLILPSVSVGNVGQLTADLLISTLWMTHEGYLYDDSLLPMVGNDAFVNSAEGCNLTTAAQVYESKTHKLVVVQQRAPLVKGKKAQFVSRLFEWVKTCSFREVVILSSMFAHHRLDNQLHGVQLRHVTSAAYSEQHAETLSDAVSLSLEALPAPPGAPLDRPYIPGAGLAPTYHKKCDELGLPSAIMLRFCAEGDNANDALELATHLNSLYDWVDLKENAQKLQFEGRAGWRMPSSWRLQYGSGFHQMLFQ